MSTIQLAPAPLRSPVFDQRGTMSQDWQRWFMQLFVLGQSVVEVTNNTTALIQSGAGDSSGSAARDFSPAIQEALLQSQGDPQRDFGPAIEEVLRRLQSDTTKNYSPEIEEALNQSLSDPGRPWGTLIEEGSARSLLSDTPKDFSAAIQDALLASLPDTVRDFAPAIALAVEEAIRTALPDTVRDFAPQIQEALLQGQGGDPQRGQVTRADLDDLRVLVAAADLPRGSSWLASQDANGWTLTNLAGISGSAFGNLTETTSAVLVITGGSGGVIGNITIQVRQASGSGPGFLTQADWTTFNSKQNALALGNLTEATSSVLTIVGGTGATVGSVSIQVKAASPTQAGFLAAADYVALQDRVQQQGLGDPRGQDFGPAIQDALLASLPDTVRDFAPAIALAVEEAIRTALPDTIRDFAPQIQEAALQARGELRSQVTLADFEDLRNLVAGLAAPGGLPISWGSWTPTFAADGAMTVSAATVVTAIYIIIGPICFFQLQASMTLGGSAGFAIYYTLPFPSASGSSTVFFNGFTYNTTAWVNGFGFANGSPSASQGTIQKVPLVTYTLGAGTNIGIAGFYRIA